MWPAGLTAQKTVGSSLSWRPEDNLDIQWLLYWRQARSALIVLGPAAMTLGLIGALALRNRVLLRPRGTPNSLLIEAHPAR